MCLVALRTVVNHAKEIPNFLFVPTQAETPLSCVDQPLLDIPIRIYGIRSVAGDGLSDAEASHKLPQVCGDFEWQFDQSSRLVSSARFYLRVRFVDIDALSTGA